MACSGLQSWNAKAVGCCQTNGIAGIAYSFTMTAIPPGEHRICMQKRTNFSFAGGPETLPDCRSLCASRRVNGLQRTVNGLQRSLSTT
jgi:hypothetical protein